MTSTEAAQEPHPAAEPAKRQSEEGRSAGLLKPLLGVLPFVFYVVIRSAYSSFYGPLGLSPDDLGLSYPDLLAQSAIAAVALLVIAFLLALIFVLPVAGLELGDLPLPTGLAALLVVILLVVLSEVNDTSARWIVTIGGLALVSVSINGVRKRLVRQRTVLGRPERLWWGAALAVCAIAAVLVASSNLISEANREAQLVKRGVPIHFVLSRGLNQVRVTSWGAEAATLSWTTTAPDPTLRALAHACLMYLGQSSGTLFVYAPNQSPPATFRVPAAAAVVRVVPGASCRPGMAAPPL